MLFLPWLQFFFVALVVVVVVDAIQLLLRTVQFSFAALLLLLFAFNRIHTDTLSLTNLLHKVDSLCHTSFGLSLLLSRDLYGVCLFCGEFVASNIMLTLLSSEPLNWLIDTIHLALVLFSYALRFCSPTHTILRSHTVTVLSKASRLRSDSLRLTCWLFDFYLITIIQFFSVCCFRSFVSICLFINFFQLSNHLIDHTHLLSHN